MVESVALIVSFSLHGHQIVLELPDGTDLIQKKISESQCFYELPLLENIRAHARQGALCVDVGAHLGNHTIFLAKICGMRVLAFEPQPDIYRLLVRNVELNGVQDRVKTFNTALGEASGLGRLDRILENNTGTARFAFDDKGDIPITTLDEHVGDQRVSLMKIDVEGFEIEVLKGAEKTIERDKPLIYAEAASPPARKILETHLSHYGYVSGEQFCATPVVQFEACRDDQQRFSLLADRIERTQNELEKGLQRQMHDDARDMRRRLGSLSKVSSSLDQRLATVEARISDALQGRLPALEDSLEQVSSALVQQKAMLFELWGLGMQNQRLGARAGESEAYRPLNAEALALATWVPKHKSWTVPRDREADSFLQGYTDQISVHAGEEIVFRASTTRVPVFAKIRVFGFSGLGAVGPIELAVSPTIAVPANGVWHEGTSETIDPSLWQEVYRLCIGRSWRPGCYVARFETFDGHAFLHPFWVTSKEPQSKVVRLSCAMTHIARNRWGATAATAVPVPPGSKLGRLFHQPPTQSRASACNRLYRPYHGARGGRALHNELPLFRWATANAVSLDCLTDLQVQQDPTLLDAYDQIVLAGDTSFVTRELLERLLLHKSRGGSISVFGAAPGAYELRPNIEDGTLDRVSHNSEQAAHWSRINESLWKVKSRSPKGKALDFVVLPEAMATILANSGCDTPITIEGLCSGRISATDLVASDPALVARSGTGDRQCDSTMETTPEGGRIFVAGTDAWTAEIDDQFISNSRLRSPALDFMTAKILGVAADTDNRQPLVSVIMTAYDSTKFISKAIDSILMQSYPHLELIIVDDNSSDETFELLLDYAAKDRRVRPFKSFENHGTYWSKNFGMTQAWGRLITFQDSDDVSDPDRLLLQVQALRWNPAAVATMVDYERRSETGELILNRGVAHRRCFPSLMIRTDTVLQKIGFFDSVRTSADQEYLHRLRLVFGNDAVIELRRPLYQALVRQGSLTMSAGAEVNLAAESGATDGHLSTGRRRYVAAFQEWHQRIAHKETAPYLAFPLVERPFSIMPELDIEEGRKQSVLARGVIIVGPGRDEAEEAAAPLRDSTRELWRFVHGGRPEDVDLDDLEIRTIAASADFQFELKPIPGGELSNGIVGIRRPDDEQEQSQRRSARQQNRAELLDVVLMSDFRFSGGTSQSNAAEIACQAKHGLVTGLVQTPSPVLTRDHPINPLIQRLVTHGDAQFVPEGQVARCRLLIIRHPTVLQRHASELPRIEAEKVVVIVNQAPSDPKSGRVYYDMVECQSNARRVYGSEGTWYPIGPLIRGAVENLPGANFLASTDWYNIIDLAQWRVERRTFVGTRPVIGRHSRDSLEKWPDDPQKLLAAYPDDPAFEVRVLGGAETVRNLLGAIPARWQVSAFGSQSPRDFLASIDFFVYFHHPTLVEAFGRTILEALAAGVPVILPRHFEQLFEDVPIYCEPGDVRKVVEELYADRERYEQISRRGVEFVERRFGYNAHVSRVGALVPEFTADASARTTPAEVREPPSGAIVESAALEADMVYKMSVRLSGITSASRGTVSAVSQNTGKLLFDLPIDGSQEVVSKLFVNPDRPDRMDVLVHVEDGSPQFSVNKISVVRRAERPRQPSLALSDTSVTAAFATYPARREILPDVIDTLVSQVDRLFIYLNNYDEVPRCITEHPLRDRLVYILDPASQRRAAAKFHWLEIARGFHLVCDDDILYPPDYARRMVEAIEKRNRKAILGVHGVIFSSHLKDARSSRLNVFKFPAALAEDTAVHFLGTGTVALHSSVLSGMDISKFMSYPIANDEILAVSAKNAGIPMVCIGRGEGWLRPHPEMRFGIFEERQLDEGEHDKASELLADANPWPDLPLPR